MNIVEMTAHRSNYGAYRAEKEIKFIVIHYTGNDGDKARNNGKYFQGANRNASAHYFVDDSEIVQSVPDDYAAWHCGTKGKYKHKMCRNGNSIGIELCDELRNGTIYPSEKAIQNAVWLTRKLMKKYNIPIQNVIRHYDVTGKECPRYWVNDASWREDFLSRIEVANKVDFVRDEIEVIIDGKVHKIAGTLVQGINYVAIGEYTRKLGLEITNNGKTPVVKTK